MQKINIESRNDFTIRSLTYVNGLRIKLDSNFTTLASNMKTIFYFLPVLNFFVFLAIFFLIFRALNKRPLPIALFGVTLIGVGAFLWFILFSWVGSCAYGNDLFFKKDITPIGQQFSTPAIFGFTVGFLIKSVRVFGEWFDRRHPKRHTR